MDKINFYYLLFVTVFLTSINNLQAETANLPAKDDIKVGQIVADNGFIYRMVVAIQKDQSYQVQNFYKDTHTKQSDTFIIKDKNALGTFQQILIYDMSNFSIQGPLVLWSKDGKQHMNFYLNKGKAEGPFTKYYTDTDNKEIEGHYYRGKPDGLWIYNAPNGTLEKKVYYKQGIIQWQYDTPILPTSTKLLPH